MTFKEKLEKEHPERVSSRFGGGCDGCPSDYGYEEKTDRCPDESCLYCWNREIPTPMTAEEAWVLAKKIVLPTSNGGAFKASELREIFDSDIESYILKNNTPQEAKAKIEAWESKQIRVGDVVLGSIDEEAIVAKTKEETMYLIFADGSCGEHRKENFKKTSKHIDIQSVLEQIGEEEWI